MMPCPWTVTRIRPTESVVVDALGKRVPGVPLRDEIAVSGWSVPRSDEPKLAGHDRLVVDLELLAPVGQFRPDDKVEIPGEGVFHVVGRPENYEHSPWASDWSPQTEVVNLKQVTST